MFRVPYTNVAKRDDQLVNRSLYKPDISGHNGFLFQRDDEKGTSSSTTDEPLELDRPKDDTYLPRPNREINTERLTKSLSQISLKTRLAEMNKTEDNSPKEEDKKTKNPFTKSLFKRKSSMPRSALYRMKSADSEDDNSLDT